MTQYPDLNKLSVLCYPDPSLRVHAQQLQEIDSFLNEMQARMAELLEEARGLGLASTQVGWPFRFVLLNTGIDAQEFTPEGFVNPVIIAKDGKQMEEEGCLSLPGIYAKVKRAERVRVRATRFNGEVVEFEAEGLMARAWQHELDHLDGSLFVDRVGPTARIMISGQLHRLEEEYEEDEEATEDNIPTDESEKAE